MPTQWRRWNLRDVALLLSGTAIVAVVLVMIGRELGLSGQATADTPPLTLSLFLPDGEHCETHAATGYYAANLNDSTKNESTGWGKVGETSIRWQVNGGTPSYTLTIDGEHRDATGDYEGASGTASVSCAMAFEDTYIKSWATGEPARRYETEPLVDAGIKTMSAIVKDGNGATAIASIDINVILVVPGSGAILEGGKTYRVFNHLITPPPGRKVLVGGAQEPQCSADYKGRCDEGFSLYIINTPAAIALYMTDGIEANRWGISGDGSATDAVRTADNEELTSYLDELVDSVGTYPTIAGSQ